MSGGSVGGDEEKKKRREEIKAKASYNLATGCGAGCDINRHVHQGKAD